MFLLLLACANHQPETTAPPAAAAPAPAAAAPAPVEATPVATTEAKAYLTVDEAYARTPAGESAELCVQGEYLAGFERLSLSTPGGEIACWAQIPIDLPPTTPAHRGLPGVRAKVQLCGTLSRADGPRGFGHMGHYPCSITADKVDVTEPLPLPEPPAPKR